MRFVYGKQEMRSLSRSQESCFLLTNGLGGYASLTAAYSANRCDQGVLIAAQKAPGERVTLVHRLRETLTVDGKPYWLSTQQFADGTTPDTNSRPPSSGATSIRRPPGSRKRTPNTLSLKNGAGPAAQPWQRLCLSPL